MLVKFFERLQSIWTPVDSIKNNYTAVSCSLFNQSLESVIHSVISMADLFDSVAPATSAMTAFIANAAAITGQLDHDSKAKHRSFLELTGSEF